MIKPKINYDNDANDVNYYAGKRISHHICTENKNCAAGNSDAYLMKDYPRYYSGDGQPPSGLNPYQDDYDVGKHNNYYSGIRSAVPYEGTNYGVHKSKDVNNYNYNYNYTPVVQYYSDVNSDPAKIINYKYKNGEFDIHTLKQQNPNIFTTPMYDDYSRYDINVGRKYSPRYLNWHQEEMQPTKSAIENWGDPMQSIMNYYYYPQASKYYPELQYFQKSHAQKYNTAAENLDIIENSEDGIYFKNNNLPFDHVEWEGRVYDCSKLPKAEWCGDPIYGSTLHMKCAAQQKYLGRTNGGGDCSLDSACLAGQDYNNAVDCIKSVEDAGRAGLLTNVERPPADCGKKVNLVFPNQLDSWKNHSYIHRDLRNNY